MHTLIRTTTLPSDKPRLLPVTTELNITRNRGDSVSLTCNSTGTSPANVTWLRDNRLIPHHLNRRIDMRQEEMDDLSSRRGLRITTNVLTVLDLLPADGGSYQCRVTNQIGSSISPLPYTLSVASGSLSLQEHL